MSWMEKAASSDRIRVERNIQRLEDLKTRVHELGFFVSASQSGGYQLLVDLMDENLVKGRKKVYSKLKDALIGENNSKIALDAPTRFQGIMIEAEELIDREIVKEKKEMLQILSESNDKSG